MIEDLGSYQVLYGTVDGTPVRARLSGDEQLQISRDLSASPCAGEDLFFFDRETGKTVHTMRGERDLRDSRTGPRAAAAAAGDPLHRPLRRLPLHHVLHLQPEQRHHRQSPLPDRRPRQLRRHPPRPPPSDARWATPSSSPSSRSCWWWSSATSSPSCCARPFRGKWLVRFLVLLPWTTPIALGTIGFLWFFDSLYSPIDWLLRHFGLLGHPGALLGVAQQPLLARPAGAGDAGGHHRPRLAAAAPGGGDHAGRDELHPPGDHRGRRGRRRRLFPAPVPDRPAAALPGDRAWRSSSPPSSPSPT